METVKYLIRTYYTKGSIREDIITFWDTQRNKNENERSYEAKQSKAAARCGNFHSADEKNKLYVDRLNEYIETLMARYREEERRVTYLEVVHFARSKGE